MRNEGGRCVKQKAKTPPDAARTLERRRAPVRRREGSGNCAVSAESCSAGSGYHGSIRQGSVRESRTWRNGGRAVESGESRAQSEIWGGPRPCSSRKRTRSTPSLTISRAGQQRILENTSKPANPTLRLALKAQSQCRATVETLAEIKNPAVIYARQANVTTGPQQENNGVPSRAREIETEQSKLSGGSRELLPDTRASQNESRINPPGGSRGQSPPGLSQAEGKAKVSRNADKGGQRELLRSLARLLREQEKACGREAP